MSFFRFAGPQTVFHIKNAGRATEADGQSTAAVYKTVFLLSKEVILHLSGSLFFFSCYIVRVDQYSKIVALSSIVVEQTLK